MKKAGYILWILIFFNTKAINAQPVSRYNTFSYGVNEGLLQTTIKDMEIDKNNFCWISFPNGVQKFDGNRFTNVPIQAGLPDDKNIDLFRCVNGDLLLSHEKGISKYNILTDDFSWVHRADETLQWPLTIIGEAQGFIYCSDENGVITALDYTSFKVDHKFKTGLQLSFLDVNIRSTFSNNIIDNKAALKSGSFIYLIDFGQKKIIHKIEVPGILYATMLRMKSAHEVLYIDPHSFNKLNILNFKTGKHSFNVLKGIPGGQFLRGGIFPWHNKKLLFFNNRLYETDSLMVGLKSELVNFQNQPVAGENSISRMVNDNFGNLYLQTVNGGIRKVLRHNYPIKYFGGTEPKSNNITAVLPDKENNRILCGGNSGLFIYDTLQQLLKHINPPDQKNFFPNGILKTGNGDYLIFVYGSSIAYRLNRNLATLAPIMISGSSPQETARVDFFGNALYNNGQTALFQSQGKLYAIDFEKNKITEHQFSSAYIMGGMWHNNRFISHGKQELIFLDGHTLKPIKKVPFTQGAGVRCLTTDEQGYIYAGTNKGVYKLDSNGTTLRKWDKTTGLPDECIYAMHFDNTGALWCSTNKGIIRIYQNNNLFTLSKQDGLQENEFNTNVMSVAEDGELFFGGINGVSSFYPHQIRSISDNISLLLTGIYANNQIIHNIQANQLKELRLPFGQNSLSFDFVAMGSNNPDQYIYQYRLKGIDKEWIQNDNLRTLRYSLSPGKYILQLYASRQFEKSAIPMKELSIIIKPPFWKTWWFYTILFATAIGLLAVGINFYNRNKYTKKLHALESENRLKKERERISRDLHDNLGAYSNAILYNSSLLENEKDEQKKALLVKELKFASKDIINTLRETIWALNKEVYHAEDCLLRIRNFIQTMNRFYPQLRMSVKGTAPTYKTLHNTDAFNLVRIVQEAVSNSIKHTQAQNITISSGSEQSTWQLSIQDDGSGFNLKEAEEKEQGNGLRNMRQRAEESGFSLQIESDTNFGTLVTIKVP